MKKSLFILAAAVAVLASCQKTPEIKTNVTEPINLDYSGGELTVTVNANGSWVADVDPASTAQVYVVPDTGEGPAEVTVSVAENLTNDPLVAVIRFTCTIGAEGAITTIAINQGVLTSVTWGGVEYPVKKMKDGNFWFTQNLRYVPEGMTPAKELTAVTAGIFYPIVVNAAQTAAEFSEAPEVIARNGYLYQAEVALGLKVGDLTTVEAAQALEGAQGICPPGWHIPTLSDIQGLVGKTALIENNPDAPYFDGTNGSIVKLNEDGFNMDAFGAISIIDNTKTTGTFMGWAKAYPAKLSSEMFCGSTCAKPLNSWYNTSGDPNSGIKNLQFYGFMPMTNKATEAEYTCNGSSVSFRVAAPVRCVKNYVVDVIR
ncbi:MAG: hypothetical protein J5764_02155 [Bacteroidales bacterium]|nr:hypothetical protein [Bacteroidales bacterium]